MPHCRSVNEFDWTVPPCPDDFQTQVQPSSDPRTPHRHFRYPPDRLVTHPRRRPGTRNTPRRPHPLSSLQQHQQGIKRRRTQTDARGRTGHTPRGSVDERRRAQSGVEDAGGDEVSHVAVFACRLVLFGGALLTGLRSL